MKPTGHYDVIGIPIHVGDLIRVKHFRHYQRRRQMWLYFRVAEMSGQFVVQHWNNLDAGRWQCLLEDCDIDTAEVLADDYTNSEMFCERKRRKAVAVEPDHGGQ